MTRTAVPSDTIICSPPDKSPYIVDKSIDPKNMGTYNYAGNELWSPFYGISHFFKDMLPYYLYGNCQDDTNGLIKWAIK